ncbi:hypothetical protein B0H63DRAFT_395762, partial [Podospora didyma]
MSKARGNITPLEPDQSDDWTVYEKTVSEDVGYRVVSVPRIFDTNNPTLAQDYCADDAVTGTKKRVLVIVDSYSDTIVGDVTKYFESYAPALDNIKILPMHVASTGKDSAAVLAVIDAALAVGLSPRRDLVIAVGGGTLMDIVGFAASMYAHQGTAGGGGLPFIRIPTTLVGIIDAGVGVKVGVNQGAHKNVIGRYYAPVACLNDPDAFLLSLPEREVACGLAEAIKMALIKSSRLFDMIEGYQAHGSLEHGLKTGYVHETIRLSIRTMLEDLQPNLHEDNLRRLVDFGHEFGHIVEALARHELPHGECVAIGMGISSSLAHRKGILSQTELDRILDCMLRLGLPISATMHGCCDPEVLWRKICTDGTNHKDGMLWLVVPENIGRGTFLGHISDIDAAMLADVMR